MCRVAQNRKPFYVFNRYGINLRVHIVVRSDVTHFLGITTRIDEWIGRFDPEFNRRGIQNNYFVLFRFFRIRKRIRIVP